MKFFLPKTKDLQLGFTPHPDCSLRQPGAESRTIGCQPMMWDEWRQTRSELPQVPEPRIAGAGFTLIETVVALGILSLGVVSALALFTTTISFTQEREAAMVVVNLAREGIEIVRSLRDNDGFGAISTADGIWIVDSTSAYYGLYVLADNSQIASCNNCRLNLSLGRYTHGAGVGTIYKRQVELADEGSALCVGGDTVCRKRIVSTVWWEEKGRQHTFQLEAQLTAWR